MEVELFDINAFDPQRELKFDSNGLIVAVVSDYISNELLMVAYMNLEAFVKTCREKQGYFYSRSRKTLWKKGETSGNVLYVKEIYLDCDMDCVQLKVFVHKNGNVCHTGARSCFYRMLK